MKKDPERPQINASKLRIGGELAGAIFALGSALIFLIGIPLLRYVFPVAVVLGCLIALVLRFSPHEKSGEPWLLAGTEGQPERPPRPERDKDRESSTRIVIVPVIVHT